MAARKFYEVIEEWADTRPEPLEFPYSEEGLREACDAYHDALASGSTPSVWLVWLHDDGDREETVVLGYRP